MNDTEFAREQLPEDQDDDIFNVGQEGLRNAYNFMRLRKKGPKSQASQFINSLRLGGSVSANSEKSVIEVCFLPLFAHYYFFNFSARGGCLSILVPQ